MYSVFRKYVYLFLLGGSVYCLFEILCRGHTHWTMFILAGIVFILVGLLNELFPWELDLVWQDIWGVCVATFSEFVTGCIINLWLGWNVWDYSNRWGNILGQICPLFMLIWIPLVLFAIVVDDVVRWRVFNEERPRYYVFGHLIQL